MPTSRPETNEDLERRYTSAVGDIPFETLLIEYPVEADDDGLAELIEADGRARIAVQREVDLRRYLRAVPDLMTRTVPLDAAIDVVLRGLSGSTRPSPDAVRLLQSRFPDLAASISEAASLAQAMWSTTGLRKRVEGPRRSVPSDFGPRMPSGKARFELRRLLGSGGWGEVYLAVDRQLSEKGHEALVAIKFLTGNDRGPWARQRLIDEATKARRVDHPNVARVLDRGVSEEDEDYLVYQYVPGGDMGQWLDKRGKWPGAREAAMLTAKIARGVHAAHAAGIVHCDLKPGNVLMSSQGEPLVADFGIAVRAGERQDGSPGGAKGRPVGNLAFISPEQFRMEEGSLSVASDVYGLGGLLYYLSSRRLPNGETAEHIAKNHSKKDGRAEPPNLRDGLTWLDQDLDAICRRAMALRPGDRYPSAAALADDIEAWLRRDEIPWNRPSGTRSIALWCRRRPALAISAALTVAVALGGVSAAAYFAGRSAQATRKIAENEYTLNVARQTLIRSLRMIARVDKQAFLQDAVPATLLMEWVTGAVVIGEPEEAEERWVRRIEVLRLYIQNRQRAGLGDSVEALLWETTLGLYMVRAGDYGEAEPLLRANLASWRAKLSTGDDPWLRLVERLIAVTRVQRLKSDLRVAAASPEQRAEMTALAEQLSPLLKLDGGQVVAAPVHQLALSALAELCEPAMLDRPDDLTIARKLLKEAAEPRFGTSLRP